MLTLKTLKKAKNTLKHVRWIRVSGKQGITPRQKKFIHTYYLSQSKRKASIWYDYNSIAQGQAKVGSQLLVRK